MFLTCFPHESFFYNDSCLFWITLPNVITEKAKKMQEKELSSMTWLLLFLSDTVHTKGKGKLTEANNIERDNCFSCSINKVLQKRLRNKGQPVAKDQWGVTCNTWWLQFKIVQGYSRC